MVRQLTHLPKFPMGWVASFQRFMRFTAVFFLGFTTLVFTHDTLKYYRNFCQIRENGRSMGVIIQRTKRNVMGKSTQKSRVKIYRYRAVFQYHDEERVMPVTKEQYEQLKPGEPVRVLYDAALDEFMPATYSADHRQLITPLVLWVISGGMLRHFLVFWRRRKHDSGNPYGKQTADRLHRSLAHCVETI